MDWQDWDKAKLHAVIAHERSHILRLDPAVQFASALHRALLWFNPLIWYLHGRIVRVAEEASDDAAVAEIGDRASYAQVLLEFMQRAVPSASLRGVPMARYGRPEERIDRILDATSLPRVLTHRTLAGILALAAPLACLVAAVRPQRAAQQKPLAPPVSISAPAPPPVEPQKAVAGPETPAQAPMPTPQQNAATAPLPPAEPQKPVTFDVVSVKPFEPNNSGGGRGGRGGGGGRGGSAVEPGRIHFGVTTLRNLIMLAYGVKEFQIVGPDFLVSERFVFDAIAPPDTTPDQMQLMYRSMLADRFKFAAHIAPREHTAYSLVLARGGSKLKPAVVRDPNSPPSVPPPGQLRFDPDGFPMLTVPPKTPWSFAVYGRRRMGGDQITVAQIVTGLTNLMRSPVSDETGLTGEYDVLLSFSYDPPDAPLASPFPPPTGAPSIPDSGAVYPDLFAAIQAQLGLKLEPKKVPLDMIIIDHVEKTPTAN
jgi:uncharacterized protein (TIGR03435 family)